MTTTSGRINIEAIAQAPLHHGGGTKGNRQILRKERMIHPETGRPYRVPYLSGNSIKHMIREAGARFALSAMGCEPGSLTKGQIHLLFSGGALSGGGATVKLAKVRLLEEMLPLLSLCGYSAGNHMAGSKLTCSHWHLVCLENDWRLPDALVDSPAAKLRVGEYIDDSFGTRHEPTRSTPLARRMLKAEDAAADIDALEAAIARSEKGAAPEKKRDSAQMIYDFEVVVAGSTWYGSILYDDLTELERAALMSALSTACNGRLRERYLYGVGAKNTVGYGAMALAFDGSIREVEAPRYAADTSLVKQITASGDDAIANYSAHLAQRKDEILATLKEAAR